MRTKVCKERRYVKEKCDTILHGISLRVYLGVTLGGGLSVALIFSRGLRRDREA